MIAKEDGLLLPPELLHDPERRCDDTRRHADALKKTLDPFRIIHFIGCEFYFNFLCQVQA